MIDFANLKTISTDDHKRLEMSFFSSPPKEKKGRLREKRKLILISASILIVVFLTLLFLINYNVVILPHYTPDPLPESIELINNREAVSSLEFIGSPLANKIGEDMLYMEIPFNKKSGFGITLHHKLNLANAKLSLVVRKPESAFTVYAVLRDNNFFSNSNTPIEVAVDSIDSGDAYLRIPIDLTEAKTGNLNLYRINHMRFYFFQKEGASLPLFVKSILVEGR